MKKDGLSASRAAAAKPKGKRIKRISLMLVLSLAISLAVDPLNMFASVFDLSTIGSDSVVLEANAADSVGSEVKERLSTFDRKYLEYSEKTDEASQKISKLFNDKHTVPGYSIKLDSIDSDSLNEYVRSGIMSFEDGSDSLSDTYKTYIDYSKIIDEIAFGGQEYSDIANLSLSDELLIEKYANITSNMDDTECDIGNLNGGFSEISKETEEIILENSKFIYDAADIDWKMFYSVMKSYMDPDDSENILKSKIFKNAYNSFIDDFNSSESFPVDFKIIVSTKVVYIDAVSEKKSTKDDFNDYISRMNLYSRASAIIEKYEDEVKKSSDLEFSEKPECYDECLEIVNEGKPQEIKKLIKLTYTFSESTDTQSLKESYSHWADQYFSALQDSIEESQGSASEDFSVKEKKEIEEISKYTDEKSEYEYVCLELENEENGEKMKKETKAEEKRDESDEEDVEEVNNISSLPDSILASRSDADTLNVHSQIEMEDSFVSEETSSSSEDAKYTDRFSKERLNRILAREESISEVSSRIDSFYSDDYETEIDNHVKKIENQIAEEQKALSTGEKIVAKAKTKLGCPYSWGASGPNKFDCSGFVYWTLKNSGINVSRMTADSFGKNGKKVDSLSSMIPGDIISIGRTSSHYYHVGIYIGNSQVIHAGGGNSHTYGNNPNAKIKITSLSGFIGSRYYSIRRYSD